MPRDARRAFPRNQCPNKETNDRTHRLNYRTRITRCTLTLSGGTCRQGERQERVPNTLEKNKASRDLVFQQPLNRCWYSECDYSKPRCANVRTKALRKGKITPQHWLVACRVLNGCQCAVHGPNNGPPQCSCVSCSERVLLRGPGSLIRGRPRSHPGRTNLLSNLHKWAYQPP